MRRLLLLGFVLIGFALLFTEACSGSPTAKQEAKKGNNTSPEAKIYHFRPQNYPPDASSKNIEVQDADGGWRINGLEGAKLASTMPLGGGEVQSFPDALGLENIRVTVNPSKGYTGLASLRFQGNAVINIWKDGTIEVDREGINATDDGGKRYISKRIRQGDKNVIVMVQNS
jgi:hypothetical protein